MPRYSERAPHVGVSTIVGIVDSQESQRDALAGCPLRNRMQAIKNYAAASRSCRGRPKGRPAVNSWRGVRTVNMARSMLLCPAIPNGRPAWSPLQLLGLSIHRNCVEAM